MIQLASAQSAAVSAARAVGSLLRRNLNAPKRANVITSHDIKLELDVRSQGIIERRLRRAFPTVDFLGEEGEPGHGGGDQQYRWVVDPIDGTVNFAYGIPHACISIALQRRAPRRAADVYNDGYQTLLGVVYDPFCDELWTALRGGPTRLNGRIVRVSRRPGLAESIVSIGSPGSKENLEAALPQMVRLVQRVRKIRIMGSAALALGYVACGRFDAYIESGVKLWDIAAGALLVECAGGQCARESRGQAFAVVASNRKLRRDLQQVAGD